MRYVWAEPKEYNGWKVIIKDGDNRHEVDAPTREHAEFEMRLIVGDNARIEECENCCYLIVGPATLDNPCPDCGYWPGTEGFTELAQTLDPNYLKGEG